MQSVTPLYVSSVLPRFSDCSLVFITEHTHTHKVRLNILPLFENHPHPRHCYDCSPSTGLTATAAVLPARQPATKET